MIDKKCNWVKKKEPTGDLRGHFQGLYLVRKTLVVFDDVG